MNARRISFGQGIADIFQNGQNAARAYWANTLRNVAQAVAKVTDGNADHIEGALLNPQMHDSPILQDILKVDYTASKLSANKCKTAVTIYVICKSDEAADQVPVKKITITSEESWDDLPNQIRAGFIRNGRKDQNLTLFESMQG